MTFIFSKTIYLLLITHIDQYRCIYVWFKYKSGKRGNTMLGECGVCESNNRSNILRLRDFDTTSSLLPMEYMPLDYTAENTFDTIIEYQDLVLPFK